MGMQSPDIFTERVSNLMKKLSLSKKDMANRLNVDYSTFWRKLNGKRNVDIPVLIQIAGILGTSVSYLVGETNNPIPPKMLYAGDVSVDENIIMQDEASKETLHQETPGHLVFRHGDYCVDVPDTPSNQAWFRDLTASVLMAGITVDATTYPSR